MSPLWRCCGATRSRLQRLFVVVVLVVPIVVPVIVRRVADRGFVVVIVVAWTGGTQKA
jgi:hypothetical protein